MHLQCCESARLPANATCLRQGGVFTCVLGKVRSILLHVSDRYYRNVIHYSDSQHACDAHERSQEAIMTWRGSAPCPCGTLFFCFKRCKFRLYSNYRLKKKKKPTRRQTHTAHCEESCTNRKRREKAVRAYRNVATASLAPPISQHLVTHTHTQLSNWRCPCLVAQDKRLAYRERERASNCGVRSEADYSYLFQYRQNPRDYYGK